MVGKSKQFVQIKQHSIVLGDQMCVLLTAKEVTNILLAKSLK